MGSSRLAVIQSKLDQEFGTTYKPKLIAKQPKLFSPGMLRLISKAERTFTRIDEHIGNSKFLDCVCCTLLNLEAICSAIIDGADADLFELLLYDIKKRNVSKQSEVRVYSSTSKRAIQYHDYLEKHNSCSNMDDFVFDRDSVMRMYEELNYPSESRFDRQYRSANDSLFDNSYTPRHQLVAADHIEEYMEDLFNFCNTDYYTPQIQAGLSHFQLEYIRPFRIHGEALARHISYAIYAKRNFTQNVMVTVAIESLRRIDDPQDDLKADQDSPIKQNPLELWVYHGANMLIRQAEMIEKIEQTYASIEKDWRSKVSKVRRDDICDILLHDLLAHPIINAKYVAERCDKTLPAANDALKKLVNSSILTPIDKRKRNRYFYAVDILDFYRSLLNGLVPQEWLPKSAP